MCFCCCFFFGRFAKKREPEIDPFEMRYYYFKILKIACFLINTKRKNMATIDGKQIANTLYPAGWKHFLLLDTQSLSKNS